MAFAQDNQSPIVRELPGSVTSVGAGQTAVVKIPPGSTNLEIILSCTIAGVAATRAQLETMLLNIRGTVSGVEKWSLTAHNIIAITEFYRTTAIGDTGFLVIPFEELWMSELGAKLNPAYGTLDQTSFQIEIDQDAASTIDSIKCYSRIAARAENLGGHVRFAKLQPTIASTGLYNYMDLPKNPKEALKALHLKVPVVANLTKLAYIADNTRLVDATPGVINTLYRLSDPNRTPQTAKGYVHLEFTNRGIMADAVPLTMAEQILELTFANVAPNQIEVIAELLTPEPAPAA